MTDYQPISCSLYDQLEVAIMHGDKLCVTISKDDKVQQLELKPYDLMTRKSAEFLMAKTDNGEILEIRLDKIKKFSVIK